MKINKKELEALDTVLDWCNSMEERELTESLLVLDKLREKLKNEN